MWSDINNDTVVKLSSHIISFCFFLEYYAQFIHRPSISQRLLCSGWAAQWKTLIRRQMVSSVCFIRFLFICWRWSAAEFNIVTVTAAAPHAPHYTGKKISFEVTTPSSPLSPSNNNASIVRQKGECSAEPCGSMVDVDILATDGSLDGLRFRDRAGMLTASSGTICLSLYFRANMISRFSCSEDSPYFKNRRFCWIMVTDMTEKMIPTISKTTGSFRRRVAIK